MRIITEKDLENNKVMVNSIENKVSAYLIKDVKKYLTARLTEINVQSQENDVFPSQVLDLYLQMLSNTIDFKGASFYIEKEKKKEENAKKKEENAKPQPKTKLSDYEHLVNFIKIETNGLSDIGKFIAANKEQPANDEKSAHKKGEIKLKSVIGTYRKDRGAIKTLNAIKDIINSYSKINGYLKKNKKSIINDFNTGIDKLINNNNQNNSDVDAINGIEKLLHQIKTDEDNYYRKFRLFQKSKQSHSHLKPKIDEAREVFLKFRKNA